MVRALKARNKIAVVVLSLTFYFALSALSKPFLYFPGAVPQAFIFGAVGAPIQGFHEVVVAVAPLTKNVPHNKGRPRRAAPTVAPPHPNLTLEAKRIGRPQSPAIEFPRLLTLKQSTWNSRSRDAQFA